MHKIGQCRLILVKTNEWESCATPNVEILLLEYFQPGFRTGANYSSTPSIKEEVDASSDFVYGFLKGKNPGFYEVVGDFYYDSWESGGYDCREWESTWELQDYEWRMVSFDSVKFADESGVIEDSFVNSPSPWCRVSYFMSRRDILSNFLIWDNKKLRLPNILNLNDQPEEMLECLFDAATDSKEKQIIVGVLSERAIALASNFNSYGGADEPIDERVCGRVKTGELL